MINVNIPGYKKFKFENIVFDYNGTVAVDGNMDLFTMEKLRELSSKVNIYILTADTYGNVKEQCANLPVSVITFPNDEASKCKKDIVENLKGQSICVGNGFNDIEMFQVADLSIAVMGEEGCNGKLLRYSDIVVRSREDLFQLFLSTDRIKATLRG